MDIVENVNHVIHHFSGLFPLKIKMVQNRIILNLKIRHLMVTWELKCLMTNMDYRDRMNIYHFGIRHLTKEVK
jgi:hypothetical protein